MHRSNEVKGLLISCQYDQVPLTVSAVLNHKCAITDFMRERERERERDP